MSDFENKLQEQLKTLVNAHTGNFEKEVTSLQESLQDLVRNSFGKVLKTASQGLEEIAKGETITKLASDMVKELATDKLELETLTANFKTENERLLAEKTELETSTKELKIKNKKLSNGKTELESTIESLKTENEKLLSSLKAENEKLLTENVALNSKSASVNENKTSTNLAILKVAINEIQANKTQSDVLSALVSQASSFSPRVALFIVKSGNAIGWMARGFDSEQANNSLKGVSVTLQADTVLRAVLGKQVIFVGSPNAQTENQILFSRFNNSVPTQILGIPLLVRGKAAAVLYADSSNLLGEVINVEALEILVNMAGLAIELISVRPRGSETATQQAVSPAVQQAQHAAVEKASPPSAVPNTPAPSGALAPPTVEKALPLETPDIAVKPQKPAPLPLPVAESRPPVEAAISSPLPTALPKIDLPEPAKPAKSSKKIELPEISAFAAQPEAKTPLPIPKSIEPNLSFEEAKLKGSSGTKASTPNSFEAKAEAGLPKMPAPPTWQAPIDFSKPPTGPLPIKPQNIPVPISHPSQSSPGQRVTPQVKPVPANDEEQKLHNDARRFARLLVSEIKLYNEQKVLDGRKHSDLYDRLKEDIDRSRQMYDKRVSALVAAKYDYFYEELVTTLAEGDAIKLGRDCPGPSVQVV